MPQAIVITNDGAKNQYPARGSGIGNGIPARGSGIVNGIDWKGIQTVL
jgi:hypothetical protein